MTWTEALLADEVINLRLSSGHGLVDSWAEEAGDREEELTEWTSDNQLRQPVLPGLRADKTAKDLVRESAAMK